MRTGPASGRAWEERSDGPARSCVSRAWGSPHPNPHLSFGFATHFCLGGPLARMQARMAIDALFARFPEMVLATDDLEWRPSALLRRRVAVPVLTYG